MVSHCQGLPLSMAPSCHAAPRHQSPLKDVSARRTEQHEQSEVPGAPKDRVSQAGPLISPLATRTARGKPPCSDQAGLTRAPGSLLGVLPLHPVFPPPRSTWSPPSPHPLLLHFSRPPGLPGPHSAPRYYVGLLHLPEVRLPWSSASLVSAEAPTCFTPLKTGLPRRRHGGWASGGSVEQQGLLRAQPRVGGLLGCLLGKPPRGLNPQWGGAGLKDASPGDAPVAPYQPPGPVHTLRCHPPTAGDAAGTEPWGPGLPPP